MIHYHGGPITPIAAEVAVWSSRHAFVSFAHPGCLEVALDICQSVALDNGAFSLWKTGEKMDVPAYAEWVNRYRKHPAFDFAIMPDVIDGSEEENDRMIAEYWVASHHLDVPVWHLHESLERLVRLCHSYPRVAFGSSGKWSNPGSKSWWVRMDDALEAICDKDGRPPCKLHGLRMLDPQIFTKLPFASADSTNAARNVGLDGRWAGPYEPPSKACRGIVLAQRIEAYQSAPTWRRTHTQMDLLCSWQEACGITKNVQGGRLDG